MLRLRSAHFATLQLVFWLLGPVLLHGQQPVSTVTFEQTFPGSDPGHYVISVDSNCRGGYESNGKLTDQSDAGDSFHLEFIASPPTCAKIFDLSERAHFFEGQIDSKKKNLASSGTKVLSYKDAQRNTRATYNYSPVLSVQEITAVFQGLGATLEFGRRLEYDHRYQKLALDDEMKRMQEAEMGHALQDVSSIEAVLHQIAEDPSVIQVVRMRAQRMLAAANTK